MEFFRGEVAVTDEQAFRDSMAGVCAPVTVVTALVDGIPYGATVSSFASLSLEPPLVSIALDRRSNLLARIQEQGRFGVNVLGHTQDDLAVSFARRDADRFAGVSWAADAGLPRLIGTAGWLACELHRCVEAGDHLMLFGLVRNVRSNSELAPLVYLRRTFGTHSRFTARTGSVIADLVAACAR
jgi:flavin reductase (DIM6/NTAB) family NADH-FMN oxidoreductase RutF